MPAPEDEDEDEFDHEIITRQEIDELVAIQEEQKNKEKLLQR